MHTLRSMGNVVCDLYVHHSTFLATICQQWKVCSHPASSVSCLPGHLVNRRTQIWGYSRTVSWGWRGHEGPACPPVHYQSPLWPQSHTNPHHIWPHTDDAPNVHAVMSWCGAGEVKTTHAEFRCQDVRAPLWRFESPQLIYESHIFHLTRDVVRCGHFALGKKGWPVTRILYTACAFPRGPTFDWHALTGLESPPGHRRCRVSKARWRKVAGNVQLGPLYLFKVYWLFRLSKPSNLFASPVDLSA
jgi:hypothetical protein